MTRGILEEMLGIVLPAELKVYVHEQTPTEVHLVLLRRLGSQARNNEKPCGLIQ